MDTIVEDEVHELVIFFNCPWTSLQSNLITTRLPPHFSSFTYQEKKKLGTPSNVCESAIKVLLKKELIVQAKMLPGHSDI